MLETGLAAWEMRRYKGEPGIETDGETKGNSWGKWES